MALKGRRFETWEDVEKAIAEATTYGKGKCPQRYVREEKLADDLGRTLLNFRLSDKVLEWINHALAESEKDEQEFHMMKAVERLTSEIDRLTHRIDQIYLDKLDGQVSEDLWQKKTQEWKLERDRARIQLDGHVKADKTYQQRAQETLELAQSPYSLYLRQSAEQKRRLLQHVLSNCKLRNGKVVPEYRKPFDLLVFAARELEKEIPASGSEDSKTGIR